MKKYLLVVFGDFTDTKLLSKIATGMTPIVDSPQLKLHQSSGSVVFHFATELEQDDLNDFLTGLFYGTSDYFILTEMTDKVTVSMNDELRAHLLDLDNFTEFDGVSKVNDLFPSEEDLVNDASMFVEFLLDEFQTEIKKPTLNELLDKISDKGLQSLTKFEKEVLDSFSKI